MVVAVLRETTPSKALMAATGVANTLRSKMSSELDENRSKSCNTTLLLLVVEVDDPSATAALAVPPVVIVDDASAVEFGDDILGLDEQKKVVLVVVVFAVFACGLEIICIVYIKSRGQDPREVDYFLLTIIMFVLLFMLFVYDCCACLCCLSFLRPQLVREITLVVPRGMYLT
jgi:hypothetical protein